MSDQSSIPVDPKSLPYDLDLWLENTDDWHKPIGYVVMIRIAERHEDNLVGSWHTPAEARNLARRIITAADEADRRTAPTEPAPRDAGGG